MVGKRIQLPMTIVNVERSHHAFNVRDEQLWQAIARYRELRQERPAGRVRALNDDQRRHIGKTTSGGFNHVQVAKVIPVIRKED